MKVTIKFNLFASIAVLAAAGIHGFVAKAAGTYLTWEGRTDGTSMTNAVSYNDPANWTGDGLGTMSVHYLVQNATTGKPTVNRFVRMNADTDIYKLSGLTGYWLNALDDTMPRTAIVCDTKLTPTGTGASFVGLMMYCDVQLSNENYYFYNSLICGDIGGTLSVVDMGLCQRLDLYAKAPGGTRTSPGPSGTLRVNYGDGFCQVAPRSSKTAITSTFVATKDSAFFMPTDPTVWQTLPVGTTVTDSLGILPDGAFLKRIFLDGSIELSAAASASGELSLTFAPQATKVSQYIATLGGGAGGNGLRLMKYAAEDEFVVTVNAFNPGVAGGNDTTFDCYDGYYPGTVKVNWNPGGDYKVVLGNICLLLPNETGLKNCRVYMKKAAKTARISVPQNITSPMTNMSAIVGTLVKEGAGTLLAGLVRDRSTNTGKFVVEAGTLELTPGSYIATLAVSNGATLKLSGDIETQAIHFEPGARIEGTGNVVIDGSAAVPPAGVTFADGTGLRLKGGSGIVYDAAPTASPDQLSVVPAFWIDASDDDSLTTETVEGVRYVSRVNDVRKTSESDGYLFATNVVLRPWIEADRTGGKHPHIRLKAAASPAGIDEAYDLVWSQPLTNICAVFVAQSLADGGGQLLGVSPALSSALASAERDPFLRTGSYWAYSVVTDADAPAGGARAAVLAGACYHNGVARDVTGRYPYSAAELVSGGGSSISYPIIVTDVHPSRGVAADCFAYQSPGSADHNGGRRICEVLVYTNAISTSQRIAIENYLMKRWMHVGAPCSHVVGETGKSFAASDADGMSAFAPAADETLAVDELTGTGNYVKRGAGSVHLDSVVNDDVTLCVEAGKLTVRSYSADDATLLPSGAYLHLDATVTNGMTFAAGTANELTKWKSVDADLTMQIWDSNSTNLPVLVENAFNGKNIVDFGPPKSRWVDEKGIPSDALSAMKFDSSGEIRTVIMVQDTSRSGGSIIGQRESWSTSGLMRGNWWAHYNDDPPLVASDPIAAKSGDMYAGAYGMLENGGGYAYRATLNGSSLDMFKTGFSGGNDMLTVVSCIRLFANAFSVDCGYGNAGGGQRIGEYLLYERGLDALEVKDVEAYLRKKWYGVDTAGYAAARVAGVSVASGATLEVVGNAPITTSMVTIGGGRVDGSVALTAGAELDVPVASDGSVETLTVSASFDLSRGGTVRLVGTPAAIKPGEYTLVRGVSIVSGDLSLWQVSGLPHGIACQLVAVDGELRLDVTRPGTVFLVK